LCNDVEGDFKTTYVVFVWSNSIVDFNQNIVEMSCVFSQTTRTAHPKVRTPLSQVTSKVNTGRDNPSGLCDNSLTYYSTSNVY